jgi:hypothetical protein
MNNDMIFNYLLAFVFHFSDIVKYINQDSTLGTDLNSLLGDQLNGVIKQETPESMLLGDDPLGLENADIFNCPGKVEAAPQQAQQQLSQPIAEPVAEMARPATTQSILQQELALAPSIIIKTEGAKNPSPLTTLVAPMSTSVPGVVAKKPAKARYIQLHSQLAEHIAAREAQQQQEQQTAVTTVEQLQQIIQQTQAQTQQPLQIHLTAAPAPTIQTLEPQKPAPKIIIQHLQQPLSPPTNSQPQQIVFSTQPSLPTQPTTVGQLSVQQLQQVLSITGVELVLLFSFFCSAAFASVADCETCGAKHRDNC